MHRIKVFAFFTIICCFISGGAIHSAEVQSTAGNNSSCFIIEPYVLNITHSSSGVYWVAPGGTSPATVRVTPNPEGGSQSLVADITYPPFHDRFAASSGYQRQAVYLNGLDPYHNYYFQVDCGSGEIYEGSFRTAKAPDDDTAFHFAVMSDAHAGSGRHAAVARAVGEAGTDFVMLTGDFTSGDGSDWDEWLSYFEIARPYLQSNVLLPVVGNHDVMPARNFRSLFAFNDPDGSPEDEDEAGSWYSLRYGNLKLVVLDFHSSYRHLRPQLEWMKSELEDTDTKWIVVGFHDSMFSVGGREIFRTGIYTEFAEAFEALGVDIVFFGHDHIYERLLPIGSPGNKPVHYINVNSGGGYRAVRPSPVVAGGIGHRVDMYTHVTVEGERLVMEARLPNGTVIDRLDLEKDPSGSYQSEIMEQAVDLDLARNLAYFWSREYSDRQVRRDLEATFGSFTAESPETEVILHLTRVIPDSRLVLSAMEDPDDWQAEKQLVNITGNRVTVTLQHPDNLQNVAGMPVPALQLPVNLEIGGRKFAEAVIRPHITLPALDRPLLIHPRHGVITNIHPEYSWHPVSGGSEYQIQVSVNYSFSPEDIRFDSVVADTVMVHPADSGLESGTTMFWRVRALQSGNRLLSDGSWSNIGVFETIRVTSIEKGNDWTGNERPETTALRQNHPNPFNTTTVIGYRLAEAGEVQLEVFDVLGRRVAVLVSQKMPAGRHDVHWNAAFLPNGVYLFRLQTDREILTRRMLLAK